MEEFLQAARYGITMKLQKIIEMQIVDINVHHQVSGETCQYYRNTAFLRACYYGRYEALVLLARSGANVHYRNIAGSTALMLAVKSKDNWSNKEKIIEFLLSLNIDLTATDKYRKTVFDWACSRSVSKEIIALLEKKRSASVITPQIGTLLSDIFPSVKPAASTEQQKEPLPAAPASSYKSDGQNVSDQKNIIKRNG